MVVRPVEPVVDRRRSAAGASRRPRERCDPIRIGVLAPARFAVRPGRASGVEGVVSLLAEGLVADGHRVTLFATGGSSTAARLVAADRRTPAERLADGDRDLLHALTCIRRAGSFDIVTNHAGPLGIALSALVPTQMVHTVHSAVSGEAARLLDLSLGMTPTARLVSLSQAQRAERPGYPWLETIPNAVDLAVHSCRLRNDGDYLLWIGRMGHEDGPGRAIDIADEAGLPLIMAGRMRTPAERAYFHRHVAPRLADRVRYVGDVDTRQRVDLLHGAIALVRPLDWPEPFGQTMIEAGACGVPVVATRRGAVPEIIDDHVNGVMVEHHAEMAAMIAAARDIAPAACRRSIEERFSPALMTERYVHAFRSCLASTSRADDGLPPRPARDGRGLVL